MSESIKSVEKKTTKPSFSSIVKWSISINRIYPDKLSKMTESDDSKSNNLFSSSTAKSQHLNIQSNSENEVVFSNFQPPRESYVKNKSIVSDNDQADSIINIWNNTTDSNFKEDNARQFKKKTSSLTMALQMASKQSSREDSVFSKEQEFQKQDLVDQDTNIFRQDHDSDDFVDYLDTISPTNVSYMDLYTEYPKIRTSLNELEASSRKTSIASSNLARNIQSRHNSFPTNRKVSELVSNELNKQINLLKIDKSALKTRESSIDSFYSNGNIINNSTLSNNILKKVSENSKYMYDDILEPSLIRGGDGYDELRTIKDPLTKEHFIDESIKNLGYTPLNLMLKNLWKNQFDQASIAMSQVSPKLHDKGKIVGPIGSSPKETVIKSRSSIGFRGSDQRKQCLNSFKANSFLNRSPRTSLRSDGFLYSNSSKFLEKNYSPPSSPEERKMSCDDYSQKLNLARNSLATIEDAEKEDDAYFIRSSANNYLDGRRIKSSLGDNRFRRASMGADLVHNKSSLLWGNYKNLDDSQNLVTSDGFISTSRTKNDENMNVKSPNFMLLRSRNDNDHQIPLKSDTIEDTKVNTFEHLLLSQSRFSTPIRTTVDSKRDESKLPGFTFTKELSNLKLNGDNCTYKMNGNTQTSRLNSTNSLLKQTVPVTALDTLQETNSNLKSRSKSSGEFDTSRRRSHANVEMDRESPNKLDNLKIENFIGNIYTTCKEQIGCRYLQKQLDKNNPKIIEIIFRETIDHVSKLMTDSFGNYLCQKLFEQCDNEKKIAILKSIAPNIVKISLNTHGTRAIQKMIEHFSTPEMIQIFQGYTADHVVTLIKDINGNHIIQKCLQKLKSQDIDFIVKTCADQCLIVGSHRHGCCVIQRCLSHTIPSQKELLIEKIIENSLELVQNAFGNYVVQYVLDLGDYNICDRICCCFMGYLSELSVQKFSSNVIEKCIRVSNKECKRKMITELIEKGNLEVLIRDSFGNYVIQTVLDEADINQRNKIISLVTPLLQTLRNNPHGRRIASKIMKKA